jgi:DNA-binding transcriptional MocR family regulator
MDRAALTKLAKLSVESPRAAAVLNVLVSTLGRHNAVVVSQQALAQLCGCSLRTVQTALKTLEKRLWIEVRQIGPSGTVNAYIVNDRVAWNGNRDGIRYSMFSATVLISEDEQSGGYMGEPGDLNKIAAPRADEPQQIDIEDAIRGIEAEK